MTSSTWHALGNTYVVVEPSDQALDAAGASALAQGTDGVLRGARSDREVRRDRDLESRWIPCGAVGQRDSNRSCVARRANGRVRGGRRGRRTRRPHPAARFGRHRAGSGRGRRRSPRRRSTGSPSCPYRSATRTPSWRATRRKSGCSAHCSRQHERFPGADQRPGRADRRPRRGDRARVGARGGGDAVLGNERRRRRRRDTRRRRGRRPLPRRRPPGPVSTRGARRSTAPPSASPESALSELDQASVRVAQVRGAAPLVVARLDEELATIRPEGVAGRVEVGDRHGEVIFVRRSAVQSRHHARGRGSSRRRPRRGRRPATPRPGPIRRASGRRSSPPPRRP